MADHQPTDDKRKPGRPRVPVPLVPVTAWVSPHVHDRLITLAAKEDRSVSAEIRATLDARIKRA